MMAFDIERARFNMVEQQIRPWDVLDKRVLDTLLKVPREHFVPAEQQHFAFSDIALPIGHGETMLPPVVEGRILQSLLIAPHERVLEIGTGTGFFTACLAHLGQSVHSVDIYPDFTQTALEKLDALNIDRVVLETGDAVNGWASKERFDVIVLTGAVQQIPESYRQQLNVGGPCSPSLARSRTCPARWSPDAPATSSKHATCSKPIHAISRGPNPSQNLLLRNRYQTILSMDSQNQTAKPTARKPIMTKSHPTNRVKQIIATSVLILATYSMPALSANLLDIVNLAEQNDQTLQSAEQKRLAIQENKPIARSNLLPQVGASAGVNYSRTDIKSNGLPFAGAPSVIKGTGSTIGLSLNQVIYNRIDNLNLSVADLQIKQADLNYAAAQQNLLLRASEAYFAVLKANARLQLARASQKAFKNQLAQAQKRYEVGLVAVTDVANAQANYDQANANIITARNALENAQSALASIIGKQPGELDDVRTNLKTPRPNPAIPDDWIKLADKQNIALQSAEIGGQISQKYVDINRAARMPTVDLTGKYGYNSAPSEFNSNTTSNLAGSIDLQVSVPLYTGGRINAKSRQAAFQYQQTLNEIENVRRTVQQGTANDYRGVLNSISEITAYGQSVESARTSLAATEAGYQVGTRTIVDVLNAQIQVFSAMANFLNARYDYLINYLKLKSDTGQLTLNDIKAINAQLVPGQVNALIAPLVRNGHENQTNQQKMINRVIERAAKTVGSKK